MRGARLARHLQGWGQVLAERQIEAVATLARHQVVGPELVLQIDLAEQEARCGQARAVLARRDRVGRQTRAQDAARAAVVAAVVGPAERAQVGVAGEVAVTAGQAVAQGVLVARHDMAAVPGLADRLAELELAGPRLASPRRSAGASPRRRSGS